MYYLEFLGSNFEVRIKIRPTEFRIEFRMTKPEVFREAHVLNDFYYKNGIKICV